MFKPLERGSLLGFADLQMDSGIVLLGCTYHASNGKKWCNPPGRPQLDADRKLVTGPDGKLAYAPIVDFVDKRIRYKWSAQAVAAIEAHLQSTKPAAGGLHERRQESTLEGAEWILAQPSTPLHFVMRCRRRCSLSAAGSCTTGGRFPTT